LNITKGSFQKLIENNINSRWANQLLPAQNFGLFVHISLNVHNRCAYCLTNAQNYQEIVQAPYFPESIL